MATPLRASARVIRKTDRLKESELQAWSMSPAKRQRSNSSLSSSIAGDSLSQNSIVQDKQNSHHNLNDNNDDRQQQLSLSSPTIPEKRRKVAPSSNSSVAHDSLPQEYGRQSTPNSDSLSNENIYDREQQLNLLRKIQLPARCTGWDRAFEFLLDKFKLHELAKFPVRTFDYIPQDARPDVREVYYTVLTMIEKVQLGESDEDSEQQDAALEATRDLTCILHSFRLGLPALILAYDAKLGSYSRLAKIQTNCKLFFDGKIDILYCNALKILGNGVKRSRQLTDDERQERKFKNARNLCLQGNLSKAYKTIVQQGLATDDKISALRDKHPSTPTMILQDQDIMQQIHSLQDTVEWDKLAPPSALHNVIRAKKAGRAADQHGLRVREHLKPILDSPDIWDLYDRVVLQPMIQGKFCPGPLGLSIGAQLFAAAKGANDVRPVQNPDADRLISAGVVFNTIFRSKEARQYFETGNHGTYADARISQRGLSKNGTEWVAREVRRELEQNDALTPLNAPPSKDMKVMLKMDVVNCFPTMPRQIVLDMVAGKASVDYPNTPYKKGDTLPTHPSFCAALPLAHLLYGSATQLKHHFPGREAEYVDFLDGLSQGCPSGSPLTMLALHLAMHITLSKHPDLQVRILGIVDDLDLLGKISDCVIIYFELKALFKDLFGTDLNMQKSSLLALQMHTVIDPTSTLEPLYVQLPELRNIPVVTQGTVVVGVPIGTNDYIRDTVQQTLASCEQEFQKLICFPYANCFMLLLRYCCNQKLMYLMRNVSPEIMLPHATNFDGMIEQMFAQYFNLNLTTTAVLQDIVPGSRLDSQQIIQLAKFQLRDSEERGGLALSSMASTTIPAFTAASFCHLLSTAPLLPPAQTFLMRNASADLFTNPFLYAHTQMVGLGATVHTVDPRKEQDEVSSQALAIPDIQLFFNSNPAAALQPITKTATKVTKQKIIAQWTEKNHPLLKHVQAVQQADTSLRARINHLSQSEVKGPHTRFDIPSEKSLRFRPTAFLGNILSMINAEFSSVQLGKYLQLVLGLAFPPQLTSDGNCPCGRANDYTGYHRLNCAKWAGRSWAQGHNLVVSALAFENRRLALSVVDVDAAMRRRCTHVNSQARGDILVRATDLEIADCVQGQGCSRKQFVLDVKTVAMVDGNGNWGEKWNANTNQFDNSGMLDAEQIKYRKHEAQYTHTGYSFVAFVCSSFGALGPSAIRYLWALAMLELRQHEALRQKQGLDPLIESERAQYRANCYRSSTARVAAAMAKATVMRLSGTPSIPVIDQVPRQQLAHNLPGISDFRDL